MKDGLNKNKVPIPEKEIKNLINKGLIKIVGHDTLGRPVYVNTPLGDEIADYLDATEGDNVYDGEDANEEPNYN